MLISKDRLDALYSEYNRIHWVHPDPLEFVYRYGEQRDREIVAFIASSLAYGRVAQILKSVSAVLSTLGDSPYRYLTQVKAPSLRRDFRGFKHRFTTDREMSTMLEGIGRILAKYGSLEACFLAGLSREDEDIRPALSYFIRELIFCSDPGCNSLLPLPEKGSACKRLNLFLRWMVRNDRVDPGGWAEVSPSQLLIPLDTHMHRVAVFLGMTGRKNNDMRTAIEITRSFRRIDPNDPVRYDFALTRLGIRKDPEMEAVLKGLLSTSDQAQGKQKEVFS